MKWIMMLWNLDWGPPLYGNYLLGLGCISSSGFAGEGGGGLDCSGLMAFRAQSFSCIPGLGSRGGSEKDTETTSRGQCCWLHDLACRVEGLRFKVSGDLLGFLTGNPPTCFSWKNVVRTILGFRFASSQRTASKKVSNIPAETSPCAMDCIPTQPDVLIPKCWAHGLFSKLWAPFGYGLYCAPSI